MVEDVREQKKKEIIERTVSHIGLIPSDLIDGFISKDPEVLAECDKWIKRNGAIILKVRGVIPKLDKESVYLSEDGQIRIRLNALPRFIREEYAVFIEPTEQNYFFSALMLKYMTHAERWEYNIERANEAQSINITSPWSEPMSTTYQDKIAKMTEALQATLEDAKKIDEKNVKTARTRLRKALQEIINESKEFRKTILEDGKVGE